MDTPIQLTEEEREAYLQKFCDRNGLKRAGIRPFPPKAKRIVYYVEPWDALASLRNIMMEVDGLFVDGKRIDIEPGSLLAWHNEYKGVAGRIVDYRKWLIKRRSR